MKRVALLALVCGVLLVAAPFGRLVRAEDEPQVDIEEPETDTDEGPVVDETDVVVLTEANWEETVGKAKYALVEFYAPWCGHCQSLKPEWAKAATALKEIDGSVIVAKVDATAEPKLAEKYEVQGYPTIKWFVNGEMRSDYQGPRDAVGIQKWVVKKTGPPAETIETADALTKLEKENDVVVVGYFKAFQGQEHEAFLKVSEGDDEIPFVQTTVAAVAKAAGLSAPGVAVITNFAGEERAALKATGDLKAFITSEKLPPTLEFTDENSQKIFNSGIDKQILLVAKATELAKGSNLFDEFVKLAKGELKGKVVFVTVNSEGEYKDAVVDYFGLEGTDAPVVLGFDMVDNKKYRFAGEFGSAALAPWINSILDGSAQPDYKSQPIPAEDKDGAVQILVGKTIETIAKDEKKDVLVEVYAPWCGYCKALEPVYQKLAERFKSVDSIVIAKMDGTENEHPDLEVEGFPTIVFYPANGGEMKIVEGRSLKSLTAFLKENAGIKFTLPADIEAEHAAEPDEVVKEEESDEDAEMDDGEGFEDGAEEEAAEDAALEEDAESEDAKDEYLDVEEDVKDEL